MWATQHAVDLGTWKMPDLFVDAGTCLFLDLSHAPAPLAVILWLGDHPKFTHAVQAITQHRPACQEIDRKSCQIKQGGVEKCKAPIPVKDRKTDGKLCKGLGKCLGKIAQRGFGLNQRCDRQTENDSAGRGCTDGSFYPVGAISSGLYLNALSVPDRSRRKPGQRPSLCPVFREKVFDTQHVIQVAPKRGAVGMFQPDGKWCLGHNVPQHRKLFYNGALRHRVNDGEFAVIFRPAQTEPRQAPPPFGMKGQAAVLFRRDGVDHKATFALKRGDPVFDLRKAHGKK